MKSNKAVNMKACREWLVKGSNVSYTHIPGLKKVKWEGLTIQLTKRESGYKELGNHPR